MKVELRLQMNFKAQMHRFVASAEFKGGPTVERSRCGFGTPILSQ